MPQLSLDLRDAVATATITNPPPEGPSNAAFCPPPALLRQIG
jgi:hypothetical protein